MITGEGLVPKSENEAQENAAGGGGESSTTIGRK